MMCLFKPNTYDPKDWQCPKPSCRTVNFKKRATCISCGARKPEGGNRPLDDWRDGEKHLAAAWDCEYCSAHNEPGTIYCMNCKKPSKEMERLMEEDKQKRATEEGRGGGLYDRQDPNDKKQWDSDGEEFDEFGRRKKKGSGSNGGSSGGARGSSSAAAAAKAEKATVLSSKQQAALERLKSKHAASASGGTGSRRDDRDGHNGRDRDTRRSRSRSRRRR
mmetsp:Transcript_49481/g.107754  ORF Transcript_49481/g.107754 Transcript_49481/m.107754 type:complete len:219 (+) Transcript_49481:187-843(+)